MSDPISDTDPTAGRALLGMDVYAVIASPVPGVGAAAINAVVPTHLDWIALLEQSGRIVMAGPLLSGPDVGPGSGLIVLRAESEAAATALAEQDPLFQAGLRTAAVHRWRINEGSLTFRLVLSRSAVEWP